MANRIKGITIEIGGDTSELNDALSATNKKISSTQSQLKDVERLLKLDPTNVTLLEQKQKLLADATEQTSSKLQVLKQASEQAAKSAENYDAWKTAYDPIQSEIDETRKKLKDLRDQQQELKDAGDIDSDAYKALTEQAQKTSRELSNLKKQAKAVNEEFGNPISPDQYNALQREIADTEIRLRDMASEASATNARIRKIDEQPIEDVEKAAQGAGEALSGAGDDALSFGDILGGNLMAEGAAALLDTLKEVVEETREYRKIMGSLEQSSAEAGYAAEETAEAYNKLFGVLADEQSAATTLANLQALEVPQEKLLEIIDASIGGWAKYGDSIPIDGLAEAINHTAKLGEVQGTFADILEWNGVSVDAFNERLAECSTEEERLQLIMDEMTRQNLPAMGKAWQSNNETLVESNKANANLQAQLARLAETVEPVFTALTNTAALLLEGLNDVIEIAAESPPVFDATAIAAANASGDFSVLADQTIALIETQEAEKKAVEEYTEAMENAADTHEDMDDHIDQTKAQMEQLQAEYGAARDAARESVRSQIGYFDELDTESEYTAQGIIDNWLAQQQAFDRYTTNLQRAVDMNIPQELLDQLSDGSEESMLILDALVNDTDVTMEEIAAAFADREQAAANMADTMAAISSEALEEMQAMARDIKQASKDVVAGAAEGIREAAPRYVGEISRMAIDGNEKFREVNLINSPSRLYEQDAMWIGEGAIEGIEAKTTEYERAMAEFAESGHQAYFEQSITHAMTVPETLTAAPTAPVSSTNHYGGFTFQIHQQPGESADALAYRVMDLIQAEIGRKEAAM